LCLFLPLELGSLEAQLQAGMLLETISAKKKMLKELPHLFK
jgi:hypothetical protein